MNALFIKHYFNDIIPWYYEEMFSYTYDNVL